MGCGFHDFKRHKTLVLQNSCKTSRVYVGVKKKGIIIIKTYLQIPAEPYSGEVAPTKLTRDMITI